jgi:4-amino-4-deoxy-L-arabinose transferase-like glycosyltransferase
MRRGRRAVAGGAAFPAGVGAVLVGYLTLQIWDVFHYSWLRGYDAWAASRYVDFLQSHHALPSPADTDVWHNPPLFYALAAVVQPHVGWTGIEPHKAVQLVSVLCGFGVVVLSFLIARELFPRSRWIQLGTLAVAAATPVLLRGSLMYHPEPLATLLATGGLFVGVRAAVRGWTLERGVLVGALVGLANLTRTWALAEAAALIVVALVAWLRSRDPRVLRFVVSFTLVFAFLSVPWYAHEDVRYGTPLAFSKPDPAQWRPAGRPLAFFTSLKVEDVFTNPYQPTYANDLLPVLYTDWWGDYSRYFHVPLADLGAPAKLPSRYRGPMVVQSVVGVAPTVLALVGAVALLAEAVRRRSAGLWLVLLAAVFVVLAFVGFLVRYPKVDGDNVKALYILDTVPVAALCAAWSLDWVRRHANRLATGALLAWLLAAAAYDVSFLVLS